MRKAVTTSITLAAAVTLVAAGVVFLTKWRNVAL